MSRPSTFKLLPKIYQITPDPCDSRRLDLFLDGIKRTLDSGIKMIQLRSKKLDTSRYISLAGQVLVCCQQYDARLLLNSHAPFAAQQACDGVHLNSQRLMACAKRPLAAGKLVAASCHNLAQLEKARSVGADFVTLSPVLPTASHPEAEPLGWGKFLELASHASIPVYALGGMSDDLLSFAERHGAYGIAGISCFWKS